MAIKSKFSLAKQLDVIADDYISNHRERALKGARYFKAQRSIQNAISNATLAKMPSGKRFSHQWRIPKSALSEAEIQLLAMVSSLSACDSFEELHATIEEAILPIRGVGELMVYDTAIRIGAYLGLEPRVVFVHAGTRTGARHLGLDISRKTIPISELPKPLRRFSAGEIEDVLCIYKDEIAMISRSTIRRKTRRHCK